MKRRSDWQRLSAPGDKCSAHWAHPNSGWEVLHCGHPTANWPYWLREPNRRDGRIVVSHNGRGFRTLADAFAAVNGVLDESLVVSDPHGDDAPLRIVSVSAEVPR